MTPDVGGVSTPRPTGRSYHRPWVALAIAGVAFVVVSLLILWLGGGARVSALSPIVRALLDVAAVCVPLVAAAVLAAAIASREGFAGAIGLASWRLSDIGFGVGAALALRALVELVAPTTGLPLVGEAIVIAVVAAVAISPFVEEIFFRGLVQRAAADAFSAAGRGVAAILAIAVSTASFVLLHVIVAGAPGAGSLAAAIGVGIGCGILTAATGRLGAAIVAHVTFNAIGVVLLFV